MHKIEIYEAEMNTLLGYFSVIYDVNNNFYWMSLISYTPLSALDSALSCLRLYSRITMENYMIKSNQRRFNELRNKKLILTKVV